MPGSGTQTLVGCMTLLALSWTSAQAQDDGSESTLAELLGSSDTAEFPRAIEPRTFEFPADHGPHPEYRNEWWYVTGNLDARDGRRFGFELTIFRFALTPLEAVSSSAWRTNQVYIAHFAVTDADRERFFAAEKFSRGAAGLAGAEGEPFRVWIDDWQLAAVGEPGETHWHLSAAGEAFSIDLELAAMKAPVLNGINGLSQKSAEPGNASYYYSITRLGTEGTLRIGNEDFAVSGLSWLDREWSSSALADDQQGWDWFALQFGDGTELMFYNLRKVDGTQDIQSAGTWVDAGGVASYLANDAVSIRVTDSWQSPAGGTYPSRWDIRIPDLELEVEVIPVMEDQELFTMVRYWEGAVDAVGSREGRTLTGRGYVEMTGYAE